MAGRKRRRDPNARPFAQKLLSKNPDTTYTEASKAAKAESVHLTPTLYYAIKSEMGIGSRRGRPPKSAGKTRKAAAAPARRGRPAGRAQSSDGNPVEQLAQHVRELTRERDRYQAVLQQLKRSLDEALS